MLYLRILLTVVKDSRTADRVGQRLPDLPAGVPADDAHETANLLHSASLRLVRSVSRVDRDLPLDGPRASILSVLVFAGPQAVTTLAGTERVTPPAITKTVAALERAGYVTRERSPKDRRVVLVQATPSGRRVLERGRAARVRELAHRLEGLSARDLATLRRAAALVARLL
jgi:DNA-binding MarR family transcriptional regulator